MKLWTAAALILIAALFSGCAAEKPKSEPSAAEPSAAEQSVWQVTVEAHEISDGLHSTGSITQYDGSVELVDYDDLPAEGKHFFLAKLNIDKTGTGGAAFKWDALTASGTDGKAYARMENDSFLSRHKDKRLAGTDLRLGGNEGWIAFELPSDVGVVGLRYAPDQSETEIPVK